MSMILSEFQMPRDQGQSSSKKRPRKDKGPARSTVQSRQDSYPVGLKQQHQDCYNLVMKEKVIKANTILNWEVLERYGFAHEFDTFFQDRAWRNLLDIKENIYRKIVVDFMATFELKAKPTMGMQNSVSFLFDGRYFTMSIGEFIQMLGIYENEEFVFSDEMGRLADYWYDQMSAASFWNIIGKGSYNASTSRGSELKNPAHRILHYIVARSTSGKIDSEGIVSVFDCLQLWSMIQNRRLNVGLVAVKSIRRQCEKGRKGIYVGAWITRILKNMGVFPTQEPTDKVGSSILMPEQILRVWGFGPVPGEESRPSRVDIPQQERRGFSTSLDQLQEDIEEIKREQRAQRKEIKSLKKFVYTCFKKMGDTLGFSVPSCGSSSDEDVVPPTPPPPPTDDQPPVEDLSLAIVPSSSTGGYRTKITPRRSTMIRTERAVDPTQEIVEESSSFEEEDSGDNEDTDLGDEEDFGDDDDED